MNVVDLGAAPGGWSEYVRKIVGKKQNGYFGYRPDRGR